MVGHGSMQTYMVLEKSLEFYILTCRQHEVDWDSGHILSIGDLNAYPHSDTLPNKATPTLTKSH